MSAIAFLRQLLEDGLELGPALIAADRFEQRALATVEARKEKDRARKRVPRNSTESSEIAEPMENEPPPLPLPSSPQTPQQPTPTPGCITTQARGFAEFWAAYPNKVGKRDAEKSYTAALKRVPGPDPPAVILSGVQRALTSRKWLDGIIPNPATWLNQDRWEDQPSEVVPLQPRKAPHERPHHDAKFAARQANHARALAGADSAARQRWKP